MTDLVFCALTEIVRLNTCWTFWRVRYFSEQIYEAMLRLRRTAEGVAHSAIAVAAAAAVASERSPKGSPCSCLACSDGIPGSVPSDCRLASLPPSLANTQTNPLAPSVAAPSSPFLHHGAARHLHVHSRTVGYEKSPCTYWISFLSIFTTFSAMLFYSCFYWAVLGLSPF